MRVPGERGETVPSAAALLLLLLEYLTTGYCLTVKACWQPRRFTSASGGMVVCQVPSATVIVCADKSESDG
jgi:hypothetical protein